MENKNYDQEIQKESIPSIKNLQASFISGLLGKLSSSYYQKVEALYEIKKKKLSRQENGILNMAGPLGMVGGFISGFTQAHEMPINGEDIMLYGPAVLGVIGVSYNSSQQENLESQRQCATLRESFGKEKSLDKLLESFTENCIPSHIKGGVKGAVKGSIVVGAITGITYGLGYTLGKLTLL